jgi:hypothetical protein
MSQRATSTNKAIGGLLAVAMAVGTAAAFGAAPAANATCASFFGIGNSAQCQSSSTSIAIAIGNNSTARALGLFGTALVFGDVSLASIPTVGAFNIALATGYNSGAFASGVASLAVAAGSNGETHAGTSAGLTEIGNIAVDLGQHPFPPNWETSAAGVGNFALNLGPSEQSVFAIGYFNTAENLTGSNEVQSGTSGHPGIASLAVSFLSNNTTVTAGPGPFAIAEALAITGVTVNKSGPGININGFKIGGAAAPLAAVHKLVAAKSAAAVSHKAAHAAPAGAKSHSSK